jgi:cytochrome c biogenesis protein CcdA
MFAKTVSDDMGQPWVTAGLTVLTGTWRADAGHPRHARLTPQRLAEIAAEQAVIDRQFVRERITRFAVDVSLPVRLAGRCEIDEWKHAVYLAARKAMVQSAYDAPASAAFVVNLGVGQSFVARVPCILPHLLAALALALEVEGSAIRHEMTTVLAWVQVERLTVQVYEYGK